MIKYYTVIVLEVISLMVILGIITNGNDIIHPHKRKLFLVMYLMIIAAIIAEWSGTMAALQGGRLRLVHVWTKVVELSLTPMIPLCCSEILNYSEKTATITKRCHVFLAIHCLLEIWSAFGGFIFYVNDEGVFCHGPYYWIYILTYLAVIACVLRVGYPICRRYQSRNRIILVLILALLFSGIAVNQADTTIKTAWLTVAVIVTLIYVFYNDMLQRVDEMTMLLNRTSYDNRMAGLREPVVIELLDVDSLKSVNDKYGHLYGDQCLRYIGRIILDTFGKSGRCYRIGGDEFSVILRSKECSSIDNLNEQFLAEMTKHREEDKNFPYISIGYARYDPSAQDINDVVRKADSALYRYKERNKIKYGPIEMPAQGAKEKSIQKELAESERIAKEQGLDISGLSDRIFTAFSGTAKRNYLYLCNMSTMVSRWSASAVKYFGLPGEYMHDAGIIWESYIHPEDRKMYHENIEAVFSGRSTTHNLEYRVKNRMGEYVVCTCRGVVLKGNGTEPDLFAGTIINHGIVDDVDPVTSLHNNSEFTKSIHRLIEERSAACIIKVGIEHFHHVNAMYGHQGGDHVLRLFGMELRELVNGKGQVFRLDGAKFALYLLNSDQEEAREIYLRIREIAENKIVINNFRIPLRIYGGAIMLDGRRPYNDYIVRSGLIYAMEQSQQDNNRGELVFIEDLQGDMTLNNLQLHKDIHRSVMEGCRNFYLCYQPICSFSSGKIIGAEALLRWKQEPYGVVPPDSFIPWLESDPAFIHVGNWILRHAIEETRPLRQADPHFIINVNIAMSQLEQNTFRDDVLDILSETGCAPGNLCLELTERCKYLGADYLSEELKFFRSRGMMIAIDDFGTGFSSLMLLLQLPVDELKVASSFLENIFTNQSYYYMMKCILEGARQTGIRSCVEGIETKEEYDLIATMSGDCYQGYYCCRPVPIAEFLEFYNKNSQPSDRIE